MSYATEILADAPLRWARLAETSGTAAADASGNGGTITYSSSGVTYNLTGPVTSAAGKAVSSSFAFSDFQINFGDLSLTEDGTWSVEFWIKTSEADPYYAGIVTEDDGAGAYAMRMRFGTTAAGQLDFGVASAFDEKFLSSGPVHDGNWHHVVLTGDGTNVKLYVDGAILSGQTAAYPGGGAKAVNSFRIGNPGNQPLFQVAEPAMYGAALSAARVAAHYAAATGGGGDTTPPTLSGAQTNTGGTAITATLSESGCVADGGGTSGTGGFAVDTTGASLTLGAWTISGTTLTITTSRAIANGETLSNFRYVRASTTDDIKDAAGNFLADFSGASVTNNVSSGLTAGTASFVSSGPTSISVTATAPTGGTGSLSYQWERNEDGGSYSDLSGATSLSLTDSTASAGTLYGYRCKQTKGTDTVTTNAVTAQVYTGGTIGNGGGSFIGSAYVQ